MTTKDIPVAIQVEWWEVPANPSQGPAERCWERFSGEPARKLRRFARRLFRCLRAVQGSPNSGLRTPTSTVTTVLFTEEY